MDCSDGVCGTCKGHCEQGEFDMGDEYLEDALCEDSIELAVDLDEGSGISFLHGQYVPISTGAAAGLFSMRYCWAGATSCIEVGVAPRCNKPHNVVSEALKPEQALLSCRLPGPADLVLPGPGRHLSLEEKEVLDMFSDPRGLDPARRQGMDWIHQLFDEMFPSGGAADIRSVPSGSFPLINVGRTDDAVRVYVFAPGLGAEDLEVSLQDNVLTVAGRREPLKESEGRTHFRQERFHGDFRRAVALPEGLDIDRAEASFRDGVCEIVLPKREELKPRRIDVQAA